MLGSVTKHAHSRRALLACLALLALAAGGYGLAQADIDPDSSASPYSSSALASGAHGAPSAACASTVLGVLGDIAARVYHEGVFSERTAAASVFVEKSRPLREAIERDDPRSARAAARELLATGHMTSLRVIRLTAPARPGSGSPGSGAGTASGLPSGTASGSASGTASGLPSGTASGSASGTAGTSPNTNAGQLLVNAGVTAALAPLHGTITGASGAPIATFVASVWADAGLIAELDGIDQVETSLRAHGRNLGGSFALPAGAAGEPDAKQGTITVGGVAYDYTWLPATAYPEGQQLRVYVLRTPASIAPLCAPTSEGTLANALGLVAKLIYTSESGPHALAQVRRVQHNQALLRAVAAREPEATRLAIDKLLNEHIVRMRVSAGGGLLSDVGGPYVLAPVRAPLRLHGRRIGTVVLSIQDDEGYKRLAKRLAGLDVLMYMNTPPGLPPGDAGSGPGAGTEPGSSSEPGSGSESSGSRSEPAGSREHQQLVKNSLGPLDGAVVPASGPYTYHGRAYRVLTLHTEAFPSGPLRIVVLIPIPYS